MVVTDADLRELLRDSNCPYARYLTRGDDKAIMVHDLVWFSRRRISELDDVEERLDAVISGIGGRRTGMIDPWSAPRRFLRRLAGKVNPSQDMYELPASFFESEQDTERPRSRSRQD